MKNILIYQFDNLAKIPECFICLKWKIVLIFVLMILALNLRILHNCEFLIQITLNLLNIS